MVCICCRCLAAFVYVVIWFLFQEPGGAGGLHLMPLSGCVCLCRDLVPFSGARGRWWPPSDAAVWLRLFMS